MFAKDYRYAAWNRLTCNWGTGIGAYLCSEGICVFCLSIVLVILGYFNLDIIYIEDNIIFTILCLELLIILLVGPLEVGLATVMLQLSRNGVSKTLRITEGFRKFGRNIGVVLLIGIYGTLWGFLFLFPLIIKRYSYAMTFFILADHPDISANDAITASRKMMDGRKWDLFCLECSFIGWGVLSLITGIAGLWASPYMVMARAQFYESIKENSKFAMEIIENAELKNKAKKEGSYYMPENRAHRRSLSVRYIFVVIAVLICITCINTLKQDMILVRSEMLEYEEGVSFADCLDGFRVVYEKAERSSITVEEYLKDAFSKKGTGEGWEALLPEDFAGIIEELGDEGKKVITVLALTIIFLLLMIVSVIVSAILAIRDLSGNRAGKLGIIYSGITFTGLALFCSKLAEILNEYAGGFLGFEVTTSITRPCIIGVILCVVYWICKYTKVHQMLQDLLRASLPSASQPVAFTSVENKAVNCSVTENENITTDYAHSYTENEVIEYLTKYKDLLDKGIITEEEYNAKKESLLKK